MRSFSKKGKGHRKFSAFGPIFLGFGFVCHQNSKPQLVTTTFILQVFTDVISRNPHQLPTRQALRLLCFDVICLSVGSLAHNVVVLRGGGTLQK